MKTNGCGLYDYPAKNTIRTHWVPFASAEVPPAELHNLRVWFFPGPAALEVASYRAVGMRVKQLVGFEWDANRARSVKNEVPSLALVPTSLAAFLANPALVGNAPDWANLDYDGAFMTFASDIRGVVGRLALDRAPRLGISSLSTRDTDALVESVKALSVWSAILPGRLETGIDLLRRGNERAGLVSKEPMPTYMLCRELALSLLLVRAFGERQYGSDDADASRTFIQAWERIDAEVDSAVRTETRAHIGTPRALIIAACASLEEIVRNRLIPVQCIRRVRFAYQSLEHKWRWTWYFAFEKTAVPISLARFAEDLLVSHPLLHHIDFTGSVVGARRQGVCPHCPKEE